MYDEMSRTRRRVERAVQALNSLIADKTRSPWDLQAEAAEHQFLIAPVFAEAIHNLDAFGPGHVQIVGAAINAMDAARRRLETIGRVQADPLDREGQSRPARTGYAADPSRLSRRAAPQQGARRSAIRFSAREVGQGIPDERNLRAVRRARGHH